ncbi:GlmU family protein [Flagellimonas meridianipacifica]|uniref:UDP-N-acetylglucosamine diphosphorylase/glucosamine-1-phosphate N-acetyltransferase n=1 Tax=Flagellimonas meridianipacifica TaxID=1080225 RepID=A0A2T0MA09_9FLAO|nr:GlmU family protein [Allomuricauda pacifica]PRX54366.1 UDP-N-acetylglucosamine diphosphorylase/glucosamine-1-phosphate N-acetyltransferase [Allomuricauda pacifica]
MNYILSDGNQRDSFLPLTFTRPVADIRIGILTIKEKWEKHLNESLSFKTEPYLSEKFPLKEASENVVITGNVLPDIDLVKKIKQLKPSEALYYDNMPVAYRTASASLEFDTSDYNRVELDYAPLKIEHVWDIFSKNGEAVEADFELLTKGRKSLPISSTNQVVNPERVFLEEGAKVEFSILNASTGPIYIGKNAEIMEGCIVRGGLALCNSAILKMGAKIYGPSTFGPFCKVGGEVNNSVLFAYSNKGHEGFLGNSVLGEWCNLGADTNTSNLKNNYAEVRLWDYSTEGFAHTGLQFCGLVMGDHSKCGINTMLNTGTVVGVSANIFGSGYPRNFVPSFSWGGASGFTTYLTRKAYEAASAMMKRRHVDFNAVEEGILNHVFELTKKWRKS